MPKTVSYRLLRELKMRVLMYDHRVSQRTGPVSAEPVLEAARRVADQYTQARRALCEEHAERKRQERADRKARGLCRVCGKVPHRPDRTSCAECGAKEVEQSRKYDPRRKPKREG